MTLESFVRRIPGLRVMPDAVAMRETNRWIAWVRGPLAVVTLVFTLEVLSRAGLHVPQVELFLMLLVAYVAFVDGVVPGLIGAVLSVVYYSYASSPEGRVFHDPVFDWERLVIAGTAIPVLAMMIALLRRELETTATREQRTRERLSTVVENLSAAFVLLDPDGRVEYVNARAVDLLGLPDAGSVEGRFRGALESVLGSGTVERIEAAVRERRSEDFEERVESTGRWFGVQVHPIPGGAGLYITDVTDRKRLQEHLADFRKAIGVAQVAAGVAHDFNNQLTAIKGYNEIALAETDPDDPRRTSLMEVKKATERAGRITRQLLAFSQHQVRQPKALDLNAIVSELESAVRELVDPSVSVEISLDGSGAPIRADEDQVRQVVMNLVANASEAMPRRGRLEIETSRTQIDEPIERDRFVIEPGAYAQLLVRDTGVGMDAVTLARVFEPFFTTKPRWQGAGLGLATVYGIVKQNQGYVLIESAPGSGSTVRVLLPLGEARATAPAEPPAPVETDGERIGARILLVEDEPAVRRLAARVLRDRGHTVVEASDGAEALELADVHDGEIDLLFTDVVMPHVSGREVGRRLAERWPHLIVVYTSGYTSEQNVGAGIERGVLEPGIHFIHKPFDPEELVGKVDAALESSREGTAPARA